MWRQYDKIFIGEVALANDWGDLVLLYISYFWIEKAFGGNQKYVDYPNHFWSKEIWIIGKETQQGGDSPRNDHKD